MVVKMLIANEDAINNNNPNPSPPSDISEA